MGCQVKRFSETFIGLLTNRHMRRINISDNIFDEGVKEMSDCIKYNKTITELRFRACNLKTSHFIQIF